MSKALKITELKDKDAFEQFIQNNRLTLVYFHANWCGPCRMMKAVFDGFPEEYQQAHIAIIDADRNKDLTEKLGIDCIPFLILYQEGKRLDFKRGAHSKEKIERWVLEHTKP